MSHLPSRVGYSTQRRASLSTSLADYTHAWFVVNFRGKDADEVGSTEVYFHTNGDFQHDDGAWGLSVDRWQMERPEGKEIFVWSDRVEDWGQWRPEGSTYIRPWMLVVAALIQVVLWVHYFASGAHRAFMDSQVEIYYDDGTLYKTVHYADAYDRELGLGAWLLEDFFRAGPTCYVFFSLLFAVICIGWIRLFKDPHMGFIIALGLSAYFLADHIAQSNERAERRRIEQARTEAAVTQYSDWSTTRVPYAQQRAQWQDQGLI